MPTPDFVALGVSFVGGGLAGAALNQAIYVYRRPRLHMAFGPNQAGCEVETGTTDSDEITSRYLRLALRSPKVIGSATGKAAAPTLLRAVPVVGDRVARMPPIHCVYGVEIQHSPLTWVQKPHIIARGVLIRYNESCDVQHLC
jgi:hypothetical protein